MNPCAKPPKPPRQHPTQPALAAALAPRWVARWRAVGVHWLLIALAFLYITPARADVWGYVDAKGIAHFSAAQLDERYELFSRGGDGFTAGSAGNSGKASSSGPALATGAAAAPARLLAYFEVSPNFKAVKHLLREASARHGMDYELLQAVIATESGFDPRAVSPKGAVGLMQLIPPTAERYGVRADKNSAIQKKLTDPATNIRAGANYLSDLIRMFPGQLELAVAAYNAGEGAVQRAGNKIPNYPETRNYVKTVMQLYSHLKPPGMRAAASAMAAPSGRVRMEMMGGMGGVTGRSAIPPSTVISSALPEGKTDLD
ncbi:lytic transglycosylase domain-containing protein [Polaromonas sp.]|uniref:lytic transglycosylase domain-containing protein n=1 Tax=Polaromonas sp. TaxID=1869339 RepID=UPI00181470EB|nr:lytic transglycosylase domain-containing protein [Polaromonas sp.]NMM07319.1 lytic transglycosylase domain-containing protein [Polaromonas sp.]